MSANFKLFTEKYFSQLVQDKEMNPQLLKELVKKVQQNDSQATNELCAHYVGLVKTLSYPYHCNPAIGEDAENIAWEVFLKIAQNYQDDNFEELPGLFRQAIKYYLYTCSQQRAYYDPHVAIRIDGEEAFDVANKDIAFDSSTFQFFRNLEQLNPMQQQIIKLIFVEDFTIERTCSKLQLARSTLRYNLDRALEKLTPLYLQEQELNSGIA